MQGETDGHFLRGVPFRFNMGRSYIFTDKKESNRARMAVILGLISLASLGAAVFGAYRDGGQTKTSYGFVGLLAFAYALAGMGLGLAAVFDKKYFKFVPVAGILLNAIALAWIALILYLG